MSFTAYFVSYPLGADHNLSNTIMFVSTQEQGEMTQSEIPL